MVLDIPSNDLLKNISLSPRKCACLRRTLFQVSKWLIILVKLFFETVIMFI